MSYELDLIKNELESWLNDSQLRAIAAHNLEGPTYAITQSTLFKRFKQDPPAYIEDIIDFYLNDPGYSQLYKTAVFPTMISFGHMRNSYITSVSPTTLEKYLYIYMLATGVQVRWGGTTIHIYIDGINSDERKEFTKYIISAHNKLPLGERYRIDKTLWSYLTTDVFGKKPKIPLSPLVEPPEKINIFIFTILAQLGIFLIEEWGYGSNTLQERRINIFAFKFGRNVLNEFLVIPDAEQFILRWLVEDDKIAYNRGELEGTKIGRFLINFYILKERRRRKEVDPKTLANLDKFLYYLLNGEVNGPLLTELVVEKISSELGKKQGDRVYGFEQGKFFLTRI